MRATFGHAPNFTLSFVGTTIFARISPAYPYFVFAGDPIGVYLSVISGFALFIFT